VRGATAACKQRPVRGWRDAGPAGRGRQVWSWLEDSGLEISTACMNAYVSALVKQARMAAATLPPARRLPRRRPTSYSPGAPCESAAGPRHARPRARRAVAPAAVQAAPAGVLKALCGAAACACARRAKVWNLQGAASASAPSGPTLPYPHSYPAGGRGAGRRRAGRSARCWRRARAASRPSAPSTRCWRRRRGRATRPSRRGYPQPCTQSVPPVPPPAGYPGRQRACKRVTRHALTWTLFTGVAALCPSTMQAHQ
jgi:hypothetical protein